MLTTEQISEARQKLGLSGQTQSNERLENFRKKHAKVSETQNLKMTDKPLSFLSRTKETVSNLGRDLKDIATETVKPVGGLTPVETGVRTVGSVLGAGTSLGFDTLKTALNADKYTPLGIVNNLAKKVGSKIWDSIDDTKEIKTGIEALSKGADAYNQWAQNNERWVKFLSGLVNIADAIGLAGGAKFAMKGAKELGEEVVETSVKNTVKSVDELGEFAEKVSPPLIKGEKKAALLQGRVERKPKSLLFGQKKDVVSLRKADEVAAKTTLDLIENANNLEKPELIKKISEKVSDISKELSPRLKETKISDDFREGIIESWNIDKKQQAKSQIGQRISPRALKASQNDFGQIVEKVGEIDNLDDLWKLEKEYDDMVLDKVKNANEMSNLNLQYEKELWLQNRQLLGDYIKATEEFIPDEITKAEFKKMSNLLRTRTNLVNQAEVITKDKAGLLNKESVAKWLLPTSLGAAGAGIVGAIAD